jgi:hypothetical protein
VGNQRRPLVAADSNDLHELIARFPTTSCKTQTEDYTTFWKYDSATRPGRTARLGSDADVRAVRPSDLVGTLFKPEKEATSSTDSQLVGKTTVHAAWSRYRDVTVFTGEMPSSKEPVESHIDNQNRHNDHGCGNGEHTKAECHSTRHALYRR